MRLWTQNTRTKHKVKNYCFAIVGINNKYNRDDDVAIYKVLKSLLPDLKVQSYVHLLVERENKVRVNFESRIILNKLREKFESRITLK
jgi:hypothetical protein